MDDDLQSTSDEPSNPFPSSRGGGTVTALAAPEATADRAAPAAQFLKALAYVGFEVSDLDRWSRFAQDVLGLEASAGPMPDVRLLRMDERAYRFILVQGAADDIAFAGWEVADGETLDAYAAYLDSKGVAFQWASTADLTLRSVDRMLRVRDPGGVAHEAFVAATPNVPFVPPLTRGAFVTGDGGLGHIVFGSQDYAASIAFAQEVLGARLSDTIEQQITETVSAHVTFMHINERHHSIAFAGRAGEKKLHHFMIEVEHVDDVGRARDRHISSGLRIAQDIGQHPNDHMISYYGATPSGFLVEFGWGGVKVDVATWQPGAYDRMSEWGHRPIAAPVAAPSTDPQESTVSTAGLWNLVITTPMGEAPADLTISEDLTGEITSMGVPADIYDGALAGDLLSFKADVTRPFPMTLDFSLKLTGSTAAGEVQAGMLGASPVTGTRAS